MDFIISEKQKLESLLRFCENKTVLHVGFIGEWHKLGGDLREMEFYKLVHASRYCVGLDINRKGINYFRRRGFNVECGNAETFLFNNGFEVIYACDLIEHLDNPGRFLDSCFSNLKPGGALILTTNNPYGLGVTLRNLLSLSDKGIIADHAAFFSPKNLKELLNRRGYDFEHVYFYTNLDRRSFLTRLRSWLMGFASVVPRYNENYLIIVHK